MEKEKYQSYEVQGTAYDQTADKIALINQIIESTIVDHAGYGFKAKFEGDQFILVYHCYEMDLPLRIKQVDAQADTCLKEMEKKLKKDYKQLSGKALSLKEDKDKRNHTAEKVSLNNRYYYRSFRVYNL